MVAWVGARKRFTRAVEPGPRQFWMAEANIFSGGGAGAWNLGSGSSESYK